MVAVGGRTLVMVLLGLLAWAGEAGAHASLIKAEPADGAVVARPPAVLTLTFNEPVAPLVVRLIGPNGEPIALGPAVAENATVSIGAPERLQRGTHVLSWRVISADGHPVGGALMFSIGAPSGKPEAAAEPPSDRTVGAALWAARMTIYLGLFVGVGGAFFHAWIARADASRRSIVALLFGGLVAVPISVGLQGLDALALPLSDLPRMRAWGAGLATSHGATATTAACALLAGLASFAGKSPLVARGWALIGLLGVGLALSLSGHASTAAPQLVSRPAVFVHGVCVALWIGSLLPLYLAVRERSLDVSHADLAFARFSRAIPLPLALLVASGCWLAFVQLGRVDALWTTSYGSLLAGKLAAVLVLLGLAAANRYRLVPKLPSPGGAASVARSVGCELAVVLVILALVALWRFTPPPRALALAAPIFFHLHSEQAMAEIEITREGGSGARAEVLVLDGMFQLLAAQEVTLVFTNPGAGIEPMRRSAMRAGDASHWRIDGLRIPVGGRWELRVEILVGTFEKRTVGDTVSLPRLP